MPATHTADEVEALVASDYAQFRGRLIRTHVVECCNDSDFSTMQLSEPVTLRILDHDDDGLARWMTDSNGDAEQWCDPAYDVELVASTPEADAWLAEGGYHVSWVYGPSRSTYGGYTKPDFTVVAERTIDQGLERS